MGVDASQIDLRDYYCGGYFLIRANTSGYRADSLLLPDKIISLSGCICSKLTVYWGWNDEHKQAALDFGVPEARFAEFQAWCSQAAEVSQFDYDSVFYSLSAARDVRHRFVPNTKDLHLIGVGLHKSLEQNFWRTPLSDQIHGVVRQIQRQLNLENGGDILGFEVVGLAFHNLSCSWLCSSIDTDMHKLYEIRPSEFGLINTFNEAKLVYDWIDEDEMKGIRSEPLPYDAWLLVSYPLTEDAP
jgi:hypothetical protein